MCIGHSYVECTKQIDAKDRDVCENIFRWHGSWKFSVIGGVNRDIGEKDRKMCADLIVGTYS
jgi:hypothetical protein